MKVILISERRLDELFNQLKSKMAENPKKAGAADPTVDDFSINHRNFVFHFENLRDEIKNGGLGV